MSIRHACGAAVVLITVAACGPDAELAVGPSLESDVGFDEREVLEADLTVNPAYCPHVDFRNKAHAAWDAVKVSLRAGMAPATPGVFNSYALYNIQTFTNNYLRMVNSCGDLPHLSELVDTYSAAVASLEADADDPNHALKWLCKGGCVDKAPSLEGQEVVLNSAQFVYLNAQAIRFVLQVPEAQRTAAMRAYLTKMVPVVDLHLKRWIFGGDRPFNVASWNCVEGGARVARSFNHREFLTAKAARTLGDNLSYCNAVMDTDLWIVAAASERLLAGIGAWPAAQRGLLYAYLGSALTLSLDRFGATALKDSAGQAVRGYVFEPGAFSDHPDMGYARCSDPNPATVSGADPACKGKVPGIGWDISHARRLVHVLGTFEDASGRLGLLSGHTVAAVRAAVRARQVGLAHQVALGVRRRNPVHFANYLTGQDGWYRVGYVNNAADVVGTPPSGLSKSIPTGGFGFLARFDPGVPAALGEVLALSRTPTNADWKKYYDFTGLEWLMTYPTLVQVSP